MFLEKSSYHISKTSVQPDSNKINQKNLNDINNVENEKSFWSWFKGLVNPLQNLPIISGIYSSFNSEDPNSDRDLVQNSLGGFLYGGPFGAIAGFGNWMFNKLFNKTPAEFALDFTGASKLWKNDNQNEKGLSTQKKLFEENKQITSPQKKVKIEKDYKILQKSINVSQLPTTNNLKKEDLQKSIRPLIKGEIQDLQISENQTKIKPTTKINSDFRKIQFNYPEWKPDLDLPNGSLQNSNTKKELFKNYLYKDPESEKSSIINIDA